MKKNHKYEAWHYHALKKMFLVMRIVIVILIVCIMQSFALESYTQNSKISLSVKEMKLEDIIMRIEDQTKYRFAYNKTEIDVDKSYSVEINNEEINELLNKLFENGDIDHTIIHHQIVLSSSKETSISQQYRSISGKVTDSSGAPLPGVTVVVKGTANGIITDNNGDYSLANIPSDATLIFSFVGMKIQEITVSNQSVINLVMQEESIGIEEVMAIGYAKLNKRDVSTSIASMDAKNLSELSITNATQAMAGQLAGVTVQSVTGSPGSAPIIRIRGMGSLGASNDPLVVVDGFPLSSMESFDQINPNDIEKIEVLKDAAACAIYGSRGGNGIIMVTTKTGRAGHPKFNFTLTTGIDEIAKKVEMLNAEQFVEYSKEAFSTRIGTSIIPSYYNDPSKWANTDWQDVIFRQAKNMNYQLSASGGTDKLRYAISSGISRQEGILKGTDFERYNIRMNIDLQLNPKLKMGISFAPNYTDRNDRPTSSDQYNTNYYYGMPGRFVGTLGAVYTALVQVPIMPVYLENGDYNNPRIDPYLGNTSINQNFYNPLAYLELMTDNTKSIRLLGNGYLDYEILPGLSYKFNVGAESSSSRRNIFIPSTMAWSRATNASFSNPNLLGISSSAVSNQIYTWLCENTLTYNKTFEQNHNFLFLAGYSAQKTTYETDGITSQSASFLTDVIPFISMSSDIYGTASRTMNALVSTFFRVNYNYRQKYLFSASLRRDGSSRFGSDKRYATFPSASLAWRATEEPFIKSISAINDLKLRASYGVTGNNNIGDFSSVAVLAGDHYTFGSGTGTAQYGFSPSGFTNNVLTWETNTQKDIGLDLGLLKDRVQITIDVYERITKGLLTNTPISSLAGFSTSYLRNIGNIRNRGFELELTTKNTVGAFKWATDFNFSITKNKITDYYKEGADYTAAVFGWNTAFQIKEGGSMGDIWGYVADGIFMNQAEADNGTKWQGNASVPGDVRYKDLNGDGKITTDDRKVFANALPKFNYGITNTFAYKGFDLRIILQGVQGSNIIFGTGRNTDAGLGGANNATATILGRWKSESEPGDGVTPRVFNSGNSSDFSSRFVYDGSFLRIRNLSLGYNLPGSITNKLKLQNAKIYFTAQNLYTFTSYIGYNPEVNIELGSAIRYGVDQGSYPLPRTYALGLNIEF